MMQVGAAQIKRVVFWEPSVSPHKAPLFRAIRQLRPEIDFLHIAQTDIAPERQAMGWTSPIPNGYEQIVEPDVATCIAAAKDRPHESLHIFSGMRHVPCIVDGLQMVQAADAKFAIMSEPRVSEGVSGVLRYVQSWATEHCLRKHALCIFAIGRDGPPWFRSVGYPAAKVFSFAYFIDPLVRENPSCRKANAPLSIGYLGRLVRSKGIFTLLESFAQFEKGEATLALVGPIGDEELAIRTAVAGCRADVKLSGSIPMRMVANFLGGLDVLILPSITKNDGWGVVVTEALMMGVPVVATTCVGASMVLNDQRLGVAIAPSDPTALGAAIRDVTQPQNLSASARDWCHEWACQHLSAQAGARYFWAVVDHCLGGEARPVPFYAQ